MLQLSTNRFMAPTQEITIMLFVWEDPHDREARYVYGPKGRINFGNAPKPQKLNIEFRCLAKKTDGSDRFILHKFATSRLDKILNYAPYGSGTREPEISTLPAAKSLHFNLDMESDDSFYIDILVEDRNYADRIFSCDPQVENGTKT
jgi:hypothetical protein